VAKPVQIRASYRDDAAFLLRLETAVAKDDRQTEAWRKEGCKRLRELSQFLLSAKVEDHTFAAVKADKPDKTDKKVSAAR
jgi:hypothetical protein